MNPLKMMKQIDRMLSGTESAIDGYYGEALKTAIRKKRDPLRRIQAIMDGEEKPPRKCVTNEQKARWKEKTLMKLLKDSRVENAIMAEIRRAGRQSVSKIKQNAVSVYKTAYNGTMENLKG